MAQVDPLSSSLEIAGAFSNTGVPVELVEAENQGVLSSNNNGRQQGGVANPPNVRGEEAMDISVEGDQNLDSTRLSAVPKSVEVPVPTLPSQGVPQANASTNIGSTLVKALAAASTSADISNVATNTPSLATQTTVTAASGASQSMVSKQQQQAGVNVTVAGSQTATSLPRLSNQATGAAVASAIEQLQTLAGSHQALEIAADAISSLPDNLGQLGPTQGMHGGGASGVVDRTREIFDDSINFSGLDMSGTSAINTSAAVDPESPSSPESNFDTSDLLNSSLLQQDEVTQRLAQSGPIGVAAAAAIMSSRKRKRSMTFETNPSLRKRHCSKLSKKLKETIDEMSMRVGLQAVVVMYKPGKSNTVGSEGAKNEPSFKVFGAAPLSNVVKNQKDAIVAQMEAALHQQGPIVSQTPSKLQTSGEALHELPPLVFDGIPTPVHKMTQAQLRTFIPNMLKFSTCRGKPGWGKADIKPPWWPSDVPWANVRSDIRSDEQKKQLPWTDALRRIVLSCYIHHSRIDLLPEFSIEQLQQIFSPESTQQIQLQLESLQQQEQKTNEEATTAESAENVQVSDTLAGVAMETSEGDAPVNQDTIAADNQQVFTVDTGIGSCDTTGMPTLADASLAETAARLQQVADETGEVQYATQTVTVTERDAKALGQPVGSTTTVLLTAYPGGHSGAASGGEASTTATAPPATDQLLPTTQPGSSSTNVQVVYSASHMEQSISDSSTPSSAPPETGTSETLSSSLTASTATTAVVAATTGASDVTGASTTISSALSVVATTTPESAITGVVGSEYLNPSATQEMIMGGAESGGNNAEEASTDLAAQLINEYTSGGDDGTTPFGDVKVGQNQMDSSQPSVVPSATPPVPTSTEN